MGNSSSRQYNYHQYYNAIKNDKNFDFSKINLDILDPYEVLNVNKNFTWEELKDAYKQTAFLTHPDKEGGNEIIFNFVTKCFKKLARDFTLRQEKTHLDLKSQANEYYKKDDDFEKLLPPIEGENFNERFNRTFNMCRLENEEFDYGYGNLMAKSMTNPKQREDINIDKLNELNESKKFDNTNFNKIFDKHNKIDKRDIVKYKEPEPMVLANKMMYTELGGKRPDDYSSSVEKESRNNLVYTDYKKAFETTRLVDQESLKKFKEYNSLDEYQLYRESKFKKPLSDKEKKYLEEKKLKEEKAEQERLIRLENENMRIKLNNEKANRLFIR